MKAICLILGITICLWVSGAETKGFKFPEVTGWKKSGEIQTFTPKTLYEYINGAADLYLMYEVEELKVAEYQNEKKASVIVDVYRHKTPVHAFGIYSQERPPGGNFFDIGLQGYYEKGFFNFLMGPYYVKISATDTGTQDQEVLLSFAKKAAGNLGEKGKFPPLLASFPEKRKVENSETFIAKNFLGYPFLYSAFTADYELPDKKFKLFLIERSDKKELGNMIQRYLDQTGKTGKVAVEGRHTFSDPHHGEIDLCWKGHYIWGIINLNDLALRSNYLKLFEEELKKRK